MFPVCIDRIDRSTLNVKFCQENDSTCFVVCITFDTCSLYNINKRLELHIHAFMYSFFIFSFDSHATCLLDLTFVLLPFSVGLQSFFLLLRLIVHDFRKAL